MLLGIQMKLARVSQQRTKRATPLPNGKARTTKKDKIPFREVALSLCSAEQLHYQCRAQHHDDLHQPLGRKYSIECNHHRRPKEGQSRQISENALVGLRARLRADRRQKSPPPQDLGTLCWSCSGEAQRAVLAVESDTEAEEPQD